MGTRIRVKILGLLLVPLISMITLWGVITAVTVGQSLRLRTYTTLWTTLRVPADQLIVELQGERLTSARSLGVRRLSDQSAIRAQWRGRTSVPSPSPRSPGRRPPRPCAGRSTN